jgi:hypothetical protein
MRPRRMPDWSDDEIRTMAAWAAQKPAVRPEDVAVRLGRSKTAVMTKAHVYGIKFGQPPRESKRWAGTVPDLLPVIRDALSAEVDDIRVRHITAYIAHVELGLPQFVAAKIIGRTDRLVAYAARVVEDGRDDPEFDSLIDDLAERARGMAA